ncbi:hypothetical protein PG996_000005 [Apiospora saccharicola]|uniref:Uncharacterized protein n=1 Tax=Apiospora saccharicola TaxID=335842 RepID=A0ABR1WCI3_9PEZI
MAPGWNDPKGGARHLYKPSQDPATSIELYAVQDRLKKTQETDSQMRATQDAIAVTVKKIDDLVAARANQFDGTLVHGDRYLVEVELLPRATIPYTFHQTSKAWTTMGEVTFVGFSAKRGNFLCARRSGASGTNVNLDDGSTKGIELVALPSMKKESFAALIPSDQMSGDFIKQIKRHYYGPVGLKPPINSNFGSTGEYNQHLKDCLDRGLVPEPYILSPDDHIALSVDTMRIDKLSCLYATWRRLSYDPSKAVLTPLVHHALIKFFEHHAADAPPGLGSHGGGVHRDTLH